jgi:hypothetical protein
MKALLMQGFFNCTELFNCAVFKVKKPIKRSAPCGQPDITPLFYYAGKSYLFYKVSCMFSRKNQKGRKPFTTRISSEQLHAILNDLQENVWLCR